MGSVQQEARDETRNQNNLKTRKAQSRRLRAEKNYCMIRIRRNSIKKEKKVGKKRNEMPNNNGSFIRHQ